MHIHLSSVAFHVLCVGLGFHVAIGVGRLIVRFHHAYVIPSFLLDVVVRLCLVIVNSDCSHYFWHVAHRENGSFEVLSLHYLGCNSRESGLAKTFIRANSVKMREE